MKLAVALDYANFKEILNMRLSSGSFDESVRFSVKESKFYDNFEENFQKFLIDFENLNFTEKLSLVRLMYYKFYKGNDQVDQIEKDKITKLITLNPNKIGLYMLIFYPKLSPDNYYDIINSALSQWGVLIQNYKQEINKIFQDMVDGYITMIYDKEDSDALENLVDSKIVKISKIYGYNFMKMKNLIKNKKYHLVVGTLDAFINKIGRMKYEIYVNSVMEPDDPKLIEMLEDAELLFLDDTGVSDYEIILTEALNRNKNNIANFYKEKYNISDDEAKEIQQRINEEMEEEDDDDY